MPDQPIRVGVVGLGFMGATHLAAYQSAARDGLPDVRGERRDDEDGDGIRQVHGEDQKAERDGRQAEADDALDRAGDQEGGEGGGER